MQSPDGKRSSIRLTLKTSGLVQPSSASPETVGSPATRHRRTRRRSSVNMSDDESKFHVPPLPDELGNWEEFLLAKFQLLREMKEKNDTSDTQANRVSTPVNFGIFRFMSNILLNISRLLAKPKMLQPVEKVLESMLSNWFCQVIYVLNLMTLVKNV